MQDRALLRIGVVLLFAGVVLPTILFLALHPKVADPNDTEAILQSIVDSPGWAGVHVAILAGVFLLIGGLLALYRSITAEPGAALARLGFAAALVGGSAYFGLCDNRGVRHLEGAGGCLGRCGRQDSPLCRGRGHVSGQPGHFFFRVSVAMSKSSLVAKKSPRGGEE